MAEPVIHVTTDVVRRRCMTSRVRGHRWRDGDGALARRSEQHGRALMELILHDAILCKTLSRERRVVMTFAAAALSALRSGSRARSMICLSDLHGLSDAQLDRVLAGMRYVCGRVTRNGAGKMARGADAVSGKFPSRN
jgi:hypothetical protein